MLLDNESKRKNKIVNFLDIDTSKITFQNQSQTNTMEAKSAYCTKEVHYL